MSNTVRRVLAGAVGLLTIVLFFVWMLFAEWLIKSHVPGRFTIVVSQVPQFGCPRNVSRISEAQTLFYYDVLIGALLVASGATAALLILKGGLNLRYRLWVYLGLLAIILPASLFNYSHGDEVLRAPYQAALNLVLIFLGASICWWLSSWKPDATDARVMRVMIFALLVFSAVLTPALFTLLWAMFRFGWVPLNALCKIEIDQITGFAAVISTVVTVLEYRNDRRRAAHAVPRSPQSPHP
jgi:hypothetical protein